MKQFHYDSIDSTNLEARRLWEAEAEAGEPFAVSAEEQTAGTGRHQRSWASPRGGVWITVVWPARRPLHEYQGLPLAAGHALASLLEGFYGLTPQIKWPNDVLAGGCKIAGILCQSQVSPRPPCLIIGTGVNGNYKVDSLGQDLRCPPTSLLAETGEPVDLALFRKRYLEIMETVLADYEESKLRNIIDSLRARLAWQGQTVRAGGPEGNVEGIISGLDAEGRLLLRSGVETRAYVSGELERLTPAAGSSA